MSYNARTALVLGGIKNVVFQFLLLFFAHKGNRGQSYAMNVGQNIVVDMTPKIDENYVERLV